MVFSINELRGKEASITNYELRIINYSVTRDRFLLPLFQELGYGRLVAAKALEIDGKSYPISHNWQHTPIHLVGCGVDLDKRTAGVIRNAFNSHHPPAPSPTEGRRGEETGFSLLSVDGKGTDDKNHPAPLSLDAKATEGKNHPAPLCLKRSPAPTKGVFYQVASRYNNVQRFERAICRHLSFALKVVKELFTYLVSNKCLNKSLLALGATSLGGASLGLYF